MATTRTALTDADINSLMRGATAAERAAAVQKLCRKLDETPLSPEDVDVAHEILRVLARDAAEMVRRALATTLKLSPMLPRDVALRLAHDVDSIAVPVLNYSPAFTDEDLVEIVNSAGPARQIAIARRSGLSEAVTTALVDHGMEVAVRTACTNDNAVFAELSLHKAISRFANSQDLLAAIAYRRVVPPSVVERLINMVGETARDHLISRYDLSPDVAVHVAVAAHERATIDLVDQVGRATDVEGLVAHLNTEGRLTPSLLLRALAHGHMSFFEWGLVELARVPHHRVWLMVHDAGPLGLRAIYDRAGLPTRLFSAFRAGVDAFHSMEFDGGASDQKRFQDRILERFLTQPSSTPREDLEYLMEKMDRTPRSLKAASRSRSTVAAG